MANIKELIQSIESPDSSFDEKLAVINEMQDTLVAMKEHEQEAIDDNVELIIEALRTIEAKVEAKLRIIPEKGEQGIQGQKGEQGDRGLDGAQGKDGKSGIDGKDGLDGKDGVSVQDAKIDFDGSLVITLSDGREINVGEVVPVDVAQTIHKIQSGSGGDSQTTLNAIAALQATIATYGTMATQNANAVAITGGTINNTTVGATTPNTGVFTTLTAQNETLKGTGQNLILQSQTYNNSTWNQSSVVRADNQTTAPDGSSTAATITSVNATYGGLLRQTPVTTASTYTMSAYVKKNNWSYVGLRLGSLNGAGDKYAYFNFDTLATSTNAISGATFTATSVGNGWYRLVLSGLIAANAGSAFDIAIVASDGSSATNNGAGQVVYVWGVQLELGSTANTYIPTTTTAVYGTPTLSFSGVASLGLQSDGSLYETSAGTGNVRFYTNNIAQEQARVSHTASAVNAINLTGGATTKAVIQSAIGSDSNISYVTQSKGTGAIDLAAGSSGVNISNGGTVTAITRTANGSGYTSIPSVAITAPTTAGGVQATASANLFANTATVASGGTGYTNGNVLTVVGGTGGPATYTVTGESAGAVTSVTPLNFGSYSALPTNPVSVTGGSGSSATLNLTYGISTPTITNAGSGYVEQPTVTFSGGGGSGASAYATVGSATTIKSIGSTAFLQVAMGTALELGTYGANSTNNNRYGIFSSAQFNPAIIEARGSDTNIDAVLSSKGTAPVRFITNSFSQGTGTEQLRVAHTASAVNYVQVTGAATGNNPTISMQGSDVGIGLTIQSKSANSIILQNGAAQRQLVIDGTKTGINYLQVASAATTLGPVLSSIGSDTNIPLVLQPKGTGALQAQQTDSTATGGNARGANAVDWQTIRSGASQVAAGQYGVVSGGISNTVNSVGGVVGGGSGNFVSSSGYVGGVFSGQSNQSNGFYSPVVGGASNQANGYYNFIGAGFTNTGTASAAVTTQSATMNGTTAVTLSGSNASIKVGQIISGTSIAGDTYVAAISGTSLTLSKVASGSSTSTLSFYTPHGVVVGGGNNQATGSYSFIGGGGDAGTAANRNVASGDYSVVVGGRNNTASGIASFVGGGGFVGISSTFPNTASGIGASVVGGFTNVSSAQGAFIGGGFANIANGIYSSIVGGVGGSTRGVLGNTVFPASSTPLSSPIGSSQSSLLVLGKQTTDATATVLTSDGNAASTTNQVILPNNSAYYFRGEVVSGVTGGGNTKGFFIEGVIKRGANAASTALVGTPTVTSNYADAGASAWTIAVTADTTNGGLAVTFTGQAATTIRTVAQIRTTEMTY